MQAQQTENFKITASMIKKEVLGNHTDCDCPNCGYPMGRGDTAYIFQEEAYCSKTCINQLHEMHQQQGR